MIHNTLTILALSLYTYAAALLLPQLVVATNSFIGRKAWVFSTKVPLLVTIAGHVCLVLS